MTAGSVRLVRSRRSSGAGDLVILAATVAAVLVATSLPYTYAYLLAPPDKQFMGILLNVPDTAQYLSWARESSRALLIENKLTPEQGDAVFFNLFWLAVGRLAAALRLGLAETLQLVRPMAGAFYLGAVYWFASLVTESRPHRWVSFLVIALGGGLGWALVVHKQLTGELVFPLDVYVTEANTFLTVMAIPHQAMAGGLLVLVLGLSALALERSSLRLATVAGLLALVLGLQHGYDLLIVYAVVGTVALMLALRSGLQLRPLGLYVATCVLSLPAVAYLAYITTASPIWQGVLAQYGNAGVYTPQPPHLLILMGLPLILLVLTANTAGRAESSGAQQLGARELLLRSWLVVGFSLLYVPTDFQIKMLAGWQVPVGILATRVVFTHLAPALRRLVRVPAAWRSDTVLGILFVVAVLPVNVYLYAWRFVDLGRQDYPYYLHRDEVAAMRWLEANSEPSDVVLSSSTIGQYVPGVSGNRAFLAHWAQTLDFYNKRQMVARFFDPSASDRERGELITRFDVRYVFYGRQERALGSYDLDQSPHLSRAFSSPGASVYRVRDTSRGVEVRR